MELGVVTFLDVLGWKGIWQRRRTPEKLLEELVGEIDGFARAVRTSAIPGFEEVKDLEIEVQGISDTIALYTPVTGKPSRTIEYHVQLAAAVLLWGLTHRLPFRGAISLGKFLISRREKSTVMVGPAIDEVAAWYEAVDWIGCVVTPSCYFHHPDSTVSTIEYPVPLSGKRGSVSLACVDWVNRAPKKISEAQLLKCFGRMQPMVTPDVAIKFSNTLKFFRFAKDHGE